MEAAAALEMQRDPEAPLLRVLQKTAARGGQAAVAAMTEAMRPHRRWAVMRGAAGGGRMAVLEAMEWATAEDCRLSGALRAAVRGGHVAVLTWLAGRGMTAEDYRANECEALVTAAWNGRVAVLQWLEKEGAATAEDCRANGSRPLRWAAANGRLGALRWLAEKGCATAADCREKGCDALKTAAANGAVEVLSWLEEQGAATAEDCRDDECDALGRAAYCGKMAALEWLAARGCVTAEDCRVAGAVQGAAASGHVEVLRWLAERGCVGVAECREALQGATGGAAAWLAARVTREDCERAGAQEAWEQYSRGWRATAAVVVMAGRRRRRGQPWLPPELWDEVAEWAGQSPGRQ